MHPQIILKSYYIKNVGMQLSVLITDNIKKMGLVSTYGMRIQNTGKT